MRRTAKKKRRRSSSGGSSSSSSTSSTSDEILIDSEVFEGQRESQTIATPHGSVLSRAVAASDDSRVNEGEPSLGDDGRLVGAGRNSPSDRLSMPTPQVVGGLRKGSDFGCDPQPRAGTVGEGKLGVPYGDYMQAARLAAEEAKIAQRTRYGSKGGEPSASYISGGKKGKTKGEGKKGKSDGKGKKGKEDVREKTP